MSREYLGDSLYVEFNGWDYRLYTERDTGIHEVYLEPVVLQAFLDFVKKMERARTDDAP
jgi:hypothetical protein